MIQTMGVITDGGANMTSKVSKLRQELPDREAIRECLFRYSRGVDRLDEAMIRSAYWPDAIDNHLNFVGTVDQFVAMAFPLMRHMDQAIHMIGNILIDMHGDKADVESYFWGIQRITGAGGGKQDVIAAGRYLDRFTRRDDEWRIAQRMVMTDWFRDFPDSADWSKGLMGIAVKPGGRFPDDASYHLLRLFQDEVTSEPQ
jgi:hypothetical protein